MERVESRFHAFLWNKAEELEFTPSMINGMPDHVSILLKIPTTVHLAYLAQQ